MLIPDYIDHDTWEGYLEVRKIKKAADTERALKLIINKLKRFHDSGFDVNEILEESIINSWKGVFVTKKLGGNFPHKSPSSHNKQNVDDWVNKGPNDGGYTEEQIGFEGFAGKNDGGNGKSKANW